MNSLTNFSMKNVSAIIIMCVLLFIGGTFSATSLKQEIMPDVTLPLVFVNTTYIAPPKDVMEDVTKPLEKAIAGLEGVKNIYSTSSENVSFIQVELENGRNPDEAKRDIESAISNIRLPQSASEPVVSKFGFASIPVYFMALSGENGMSQSELDRIYKDVIEPSISTMDGIDSLDVVGNHEATLRIKLDLNALGHYGLTPSQVSQTLGAALRTSPAGSVDFNGNTHMVRVVSDLNTIYSLEHMRITTASGDTVLLKDIADVEAISEAKFLSRLNGKPSIGVAIYKAKEANTVQFVDQVKKLVAGWEKEFPDVKFTAIMDQSVEIKKSIDSMVEKGVLGAVFAAAMVLAFLRNVRMTMIVLVSIPLSILITLLVMSSLDITLNIMTLGGLTIAIGRVVDDSIVVIENIYRELVKTHERNESVIKKATSQVASAITSSTLTTAGVFIPIGFVSGVVGEIFRPFAITIAVALLSSLLVALTVIPMMAKVLVLKQSKLKHQEEFHTGKFMTYYRKLLEKTLDHPKKTILAAFLLFVLTVGGTFPFLGSAFMPEGSSAKDVQFTITLPRETSFEMMDLKTKEIEALLMGMKDPEQSPAFTYINSMVGFDFTDERANYKTTIMGKVSEAADTEATLEEAKRQIANLLPPGSEVTGVVTESADGGGGSDFEYVLKGEDLNLLAAAAGQVKEKMREFPELKEIKDSLEEKKMQVEVNVDQNKARLYGMTSAQILAGVSSLLSEENLGDLRFDNTLFKTELMVDEQFKNSLDKIGNFPISTPTGTTVYLKDLAQIRLVDAPVTINRQNQEQFVRITADIDSPNKGGVSAAVFAALSTVELPAGVRAELQGVSEDIQTIFKQMIMAMIAAIGIVYLIMVIAFGNASAPFAIMFSLPLAAIGGFLGLFVTNETLNVTSLIGFLMLIGIVVTNAIVLIDRVQQNMAGGLSVREALIEGGLTRLRPIIMTAGATVAAMLPLLFGIGQSAIISKGLSVVVIGGLTTSTMLTLVVVPVMYELIYRARTRVVRLFGRKRSVSVETVEPMAQ